MQLTEHLKERDNIRASLLMIGHSSNINSLDQQATEGPRLSQQMTPPANRPTELIGEITAPTKPTKRKEVLVLVLSALLGMMADVMLAFVAEFIAKAKANATTKA